MAQPFDDWPARQSLQVIARLTQTNAVGLHIANVEILPHQMIERDAARHQVAPRFTRRKIDAVIALEGLNRFGFDQRQLEIGFRLGERYLARSVAVSLQAGTRNGNCLLHRQRGRSGSMGDVDEFDSS